MRVTQKDIARKLQLSPSLVAGVLNNRPNVWVSEENRQRILQAAKELNYRPNAAAKALRSGKTNVVASVFYESPGHHAIVETLAEQLATFGYDLLVVVICDQDSSLNHMGNLLSRSACDAVVLWGPEQFTECPALFLEKERFPFVVKGHFEENHPNWCQVDFDHARMMEQTVEYLVSLGHGNIAYIGYEHDLVYERKLLEGFRRGVRTYLGEEVRNEFILSGNDELSSLENPTYIERSVERLLELPEKVRPTAFAMGTGIRTWHLIERMLAKRGMKIGWNRGDITLAGTGSWELPLLYGEGYMYKDTDLAHLGGLIVRRLLPALLKGESPETNIILFLPDFAPHPTFGLPVK